jgi:hypothetical protein
MTKLAHSPLPSLELLQELFVISPDSPSGLRWRISRSGRVKSHQVAGTPQPGGYWRVIITTDKQRPYLTHRIVYFLQTKQDPGSYQVDHVNGTSDPLTLRLASNAENQANSGKYRSKNGQKCSSIYKGVGWHKHHKKWGANIRFQKKLIHLGYFTNEKEAASAYNKAAIKFFGEFALLNDV